ncbi:MAG: ATP synthase F1 subunit delta [Eubacterium sp.]|nr:ATP synthase F1 subunit delta [Eubacterium sp.]
MAKLVSKTYGDALFELALESGQINSLFEEAKRLLGIIQTNDDLSKMMNHPKIVIEEKQKIIETVFKDRASKEMIGLMLMIISKGHYQEFGGVLEYFIAQVKEYKKIGTAYITSAMDLSLMQKDAIRRKLLETTDYLQFEFVYHIDPSLIGGIVIRIGDRVVDGSVKNKLARLTSELSKVKLQMP